MTSSVVNISIACDHAGYLLKQELISFFETYLKDIKCHDLGPDTPESVDYPDYAKLVAQSVAHNKTQMGILICGSGTGMSIAANRHPGIRAALCRSGLEARLARSHNDANVLALGARISGIEVAIDCVKNFLATPFEGGRHAKRVEKLG